MVLSIILRVSEETTVETVWQALAKALVVMDRPTVILGKGILHANLENRMERTTPAVAAAVVKALREALQIQNIPVEMVGRTVEKVVIHQTTLGMVALVQILLAKVAKVAKAILIVHILPEAAEAAEIMAAVEVAVHHARKAAQADRAS